MIRQPPRSTLFPYTPISRSVERDDLPDLHAGVAFGPALWRFGDLYGASVNLAARLCARARAGAVLASPDVHDARSEEHTSELQSRQYLVCRLLLEKKKQEIC